MWSSLIWQFLHAVGSTDGRHIAIRFPPNSASSYYNYKGFFPIVLMAHVNTDYQFIYCHVGHTGCESDDVFAGTSLKRALENGNIGLQPCGRPIPYYLLGDEAFPMRPRLLKLYLHRSITTPEWIVGYRLSRPYHVVENMFGILTNR